MSELFAAFGVNWKLLLIQAVNFGALLFLLRYFLYDRILAILDERRERIAEGVKKAEAADARLSAAHAEGSEIVGKAAREAEVLVADARTRADEKGAEMVKIAQTRADSLLSDAAARAEELERQALLKSEKDIARAAMLAAEKILKGKHA